MVHPKNKNYKNEKYEKFIKSKSCLICDQTPVDIHHTFHARNNAYLTMPLCRLHHTDYHSIEWRRFEEKYNLDLKDEIINLLTEFLSKGG